MTADLICFHDICRYSPHRWWETEYRYTLPHPFDFYEPKPADPALLQSQVQTATATHELLSRGMSRAPHIYWPPLATNALFPNLGVSIWVHDFGIWAQATVDSKTASGTSLVRVGLIPQHRYAIAVPRRLCPQLRSAEEQRVRDISDCFKEALQEGDQRTAAHAFILSEGENASSLAPAATAVARAMIPWLAARDGVAPAGGRSAAA